MNGTTTLRRIRKGVHGELRHAYYALRACSRRLRRTARARLLLLAFYDPYGLGTIRENVESIRDDSHHQFDILNLSALNPGGEVRIPRYVSLRAYDGIFIHCTLAYNPENLKSLDRRHREKLAEFRGLKIVMKQDEHFRIHGTVDFLRQIGADLLLTCLPPENVHKVYPKSLLPSLRFLHVRTGYVTPEMRTFTYRQDQQRPIDVGYRGSPQPLCFGRLCYEKQQIGEVFRRICARRNLKADISSRWEDRFFGKAWFDFLGRCKATLGVESGASVFDFDGKLERQCEAYLKEHPDADFETVHRLFLAPHEGNVYYNQVSPRHFEAAACRTVQIMYEGNFSGIFRPYRHYLPLKRDLSNLDDVLDRLMDPQERRRIAENAYREIIMNDEHLYSAFVQRLDDGIDALR